MAMMNMQADPSGGDWFAQNAPQASGTQQPSWLTNWQQRFDGAPQLDPNIIATTPFVGATTYSDKTTGQRIDPSDPRITSYNQQIEQWGQAHPEAAPPGSQFGTGGIMLPGQQTGPASGGTAPQITNPSDPNQVRAFFQWRASQQGADPYLSQPGGVDYYTQKALENGGLTDQNYWTHKSTLAQFGGAVGAGGGQGGGNLSGGFGDTWNKLPSLQDAMNMPGLQFALDRGSNAIQRSAFARGTGLSGGMLKDLGEWNTGTALQGYGQLANLNLNYNNSNASNLTNLGQFGLSGSSIGATGRPA